MEKLLTELEVVFFEQKRLIELEDLLRTMQSIAYEAMKCDAKRRDRLQKQFEELQTHVKFLEAEKR
ncbi:hypothetical protein [Exiguobacterium sp. s162]|uniref:hypothetical protein n=1 Tax=Exiguobacterium sp. s162 TaxID=2751276 RepID=UPI001BEBA560|nr:hypothetical protein [Exiguobacterium sp. s162]